MRFQDVVKTATSSLKRNKLRTALSLLGIVIGVFSVTLIVSMGFGLRAYVTGQVNSFGSNMVSIQPKVPGVGTRGSLTGQMEGVATLKTKDIEAFELAKLPYVVAVIGQRTGLEYARRGSKDYRTLIFGATYSYPQIDAQAKLSAGRFFTKEEQQSLAAVAVIGSAVADKLFGAENPIGQSILVKDVRMRVIGVLAPRGSVAFFDMDTIMITPLDFTLKRLIGIDYLNEIDLKLTDASYFPQAIIDITRIMRKQHGINSAASAGGGFASGGKDDFQIITQEEILDQINQITGAITVLLAVLAAISLIVGGIGVMNIMLVSVTERIREIGLRKALGAGDRDIRLQFLVESTVLTTVGGLIGGITGMAATFIAIAFARQAGFAVPYVASVPAFLAAAGVAAVIGIIFGLKPASKAASLEPATALRFE